MEFFLGIDLGASGLKACLINAEAEITATVRADYPTRSPKPGHSEQDPQEWRAALADALADIKGAAAQEFAALAGISFSGGAHIAVLCDAAHTPLRPAIMWSDQRATAEAQHLAAIENVQRLSGNAPNATWTLPQMMWLSAHDAEIIEKTEKLFFAKDWLAAQLTGHHTSDPTEAVGSLMADSSGQWHADLQKLSGLAPAAFPTLLNPGDAAGVVTAEAAQAFGLPTALPVYQGAIDTSMEWLCTAPLAADAASLKLASAGVISFSTADAARFPPVSYYPHIADGLAYYAAGMSDCMGAIDFIRQNFTPRLTPAEFEALAETAPAGSDGLLFYPYLSGARAPFWDSGLRAEISGLTRGHGEAAIARAAFEGVGHVLTAIWHDMTDKLGHRPSLLHVLGGGGQSDFFCQMLADMLAVRLQRGQHTDCAFASALFAGHAHGAFADMATAAATAYRPAGEFSPDKDTLAVYDGLYQTFMARHKK